MAGRGIKHKVLPGASEIFTTRYGENMTSKPYIRKAELLEVALPLVSPYSTGFGTLNDRNTLFVRLETEDGIVGWGEAAQVRDPIYLEEWLNGSWHFIAEYLPPLVQGKSLSSAEFAEQVQRYRRNNISKFAVETALWMLESKLNKISYDTLIGGVRKTIESGASVGLQPSISKTVQVVAQKVDLGHKRIKLKIQPGQDVDVVRAVRKAYPDIILMVDANSSYTLADIEILRLLDEFNLQMIEQPLAYDDIIDHAKLARAISTPVCLDESICSVEDARKAIELGSCQIINVKPARVGSLYAVKEINKLAREHDIQLWCGGMLEGDIGKVANLAAASLSEFALAADISDWQTYFSSTCTTLDEIYTSPNFVLPEGFGVDFYVDEAWIEKFLVRRIVAGE
jgi:O-succinylbenzoate synthase